MLDHALQYAGRGWPVFPVHGIVDGRCTCNRACGDQAGKHPRIRAWQQHATTDPTQIAAWWTRWPTANVAIATGHGCVVLDVDGPTGREELARLVAAHGPLPPTAVASSGRVDGGLHFYFNPAPVRTSSQGALHFRAAGGYVIAPPSVHRSGTVYQWLQQVALADLPDWLRPATQAPDNANIFAHLGPPPAHIGNSVTGGTVGPVLSSIVEAALRTPWTAHEEARIRGALASLPADSYQVWLEVGMALAWLQWERSDGTSVGFDLWDTWSQTSDKYPGPFMLGEKWQSFARGRRGITLGTLYHHAQAAGWEGQVREPLQHSVTNREASGPGAAGGADNITFPLEVLPPVNGHNGVHALPATIAQAPRPIVFPDTDKNGRPKPTCLNVRRAVQGLGLDCRYDIYHERLYVGGHALDRWAGELSDNIDYMARAIVQRVYGFDPATLTVHEALVQECLQRAYDPVADYLDGLTWDGTPRLDNWLTTYLQADVNPFVQAVAALTLRAAVRRVRSPGCKFDHIVVLEGAEGYGKSSAIELLAGRENFSDQPILTLDDRRQQEALQGVWLYEIAELTGIRRAEVEHIKAFASRTVDRARPAYGRVRVDRPRRGILFATSNDDTYLRSRTGNRRFWPVRVGRANLEALARDRDQLWAEAVAREDAGGSLALAPELWARAGLEQDQRMEEDPWLYILERVKGREAFEEGHKEWRVTVEDIADLHLKIPPDRQSDATWKRIAWLMRRLGWQAARFRLEGERRRGYVRPALVDA